MRTDKKGNFVLPAGELLFAPQNADGTPGVEQIYLMETPEMSITPESQTVELMGSDDRRRYKADEAEISRFFTTSFAVHDISDDALEIWLGGGAESVTYTSDSVSDEAFNNVTTGRVYRLGVTAALPRGVRNVTTVVVTDDGGTPVVFDEGDDYTVDSRRGTIYVKSSGAIDSGTNLLVSYDHGGVTVPTVSGDSTSSAKRGSLHLNAKNNRGDDIDYEIPNVQLRPDGDLPLKGEEYQQINFTAEIMEDAAGNVIYAEREPVDI